MRRPSQTPSLCLPPCSLMLRWVGSRSAEGLPVAAHGTPVSHRSLKMRAGKERTCLPITRPSPEMQLNDHQLGCNHACVFYDGSGTTTARVQTCFYDLRRWPTTCRSSNKTPTCWSCLHPLSIEEVKGGYLPLSLRPDQSAYG